MSTAIALGNIVRVAKHILLVAIIPLERALHANVVFRHHEMKDGSVDRRLVTIQVLYERLDSTLVFKDVFLVFFALIYETNTHARIQKRKLPQPPRQDVVMKFDVGEGTVVNPDGTYMNRKQEQLKLQEGECINMDGAKFMNMYQHRKMLINKNMQMKKKMNKKVKKPTLH